MFSLTTIVLSLGLLASQTLGAPNASGPSRHARWLQTPRTLRDPEFLKRNNLEGRGPAALGFSPLRKKDIFERQSTCDPTEVACQGNKCCPAGFNCYYPSGGTAGCCPVGETCTGAPVGCADPNSLECPASIGGCCPIGQACYLDSTGVATCDNTGLYSNSVGPSQSVAIPTISVTVNTPTLAPITPITTPTFTPVVPATTSTTRQPSGNVAGGPATVTVKGGAEKMAMEVGALAVMMGAVIALA